MATTDYDAPRRSTVEDADSNVESFGCVDLGAHREATPLSDVDEGDTDDAVDLPGADLTGEELTMPVVPKQGRVHLLVLVQHTAAGSPPGPERP
jgi:hypothetical protein